MLQSRRTPYMSVIAATAGYLTTGFRIPAEKARIVDFRVDNPGHESKMNARAGIPRVVATPVAAPGRRRSCSFSSCNVKHPPFESVCTSKSLLGPARPLTRARKRSAAGWIASTKRARRKKSIGFERTSTTVVLGYCGGT
jgi:hypothetical protein